MVFNVINFYVPYGSFYQSIVDPALNPTVMVDSMAFYNTGFISGYNEMNYLYLAPGRHYELRTGEELIVNELLACSLAIASKAAFWTTSVLEAAGLCLLRSSKTSCAFCAVFVPVK